MSTPVIVMVNYPWLVMDSYGMAYLVSLSPSCDPESSQFFTIRREDKHVQQPDWLSNENHLLLIGIYTHVYTCKLTGKPTICSFSPKPWVFCIFLIPRERIIWKTTRGSHTFPFAPFRKDQNAPRIYAMPSVSLCGQVHVGWRQRAGRFTAHLSTEKRSAVHD